LTQQLNTEDYKLGGSNELIFTQRLKHVLYNRNFRAQNKRLIATKFCRTKGKKGC